MQTTLIGLPGLDHLISILRTHGVGLDLAPPNPAAPQAGELLLGESFDPILAAIYGWCDGGRFGDFILYRTQHSDGGIEALNASSREQVEERLRKLFRYGGLDGFAYDFATVPSLARPDGIQPVVFLSDYDNKSILPIASSVDRAFDLYAHDCETRLTIYGVLDGEPLIGQPDINFPYTSVDDIARDRELVELIEDKHFVEYFSLGREDREFVEAILNAARNRRGA